MAAMLTSETPGRMFKVWVEAQVDSLDEDIPDPDMMELIQVLENLAMAIRQGVSVDLQRRTALA